MNLYSERDLPTRTRIAILEMDQHGYSLSQAEIITGVTRQRLAKALRKIEKTHNDIMTEYVQN